MLPKEEMNDDDDDDFEEEDIDDEGMHSEEVKIKFNVFMQYVITHKHS